MGNVRFGYCQHVSFHLLQPFFDTHLLILHSILHAITAIFRETKEHHRQRKLERDSQAREF